MSVLIDATVWSLALRRGRGRAAMKADEREATDEVARLIREGRALVTGVVRQEVLSGVRHAAQFARLRDYLASFDDFVPETADYELAAESHNRCRARGIAASNTDMLLGGLALRRDAPIFTMDGDFPRYAGVLGIGLHVPREKVA